MVASWLGAPTPKPVSSQNPSPGQRLLDRIAALGLLPIEFSRFSGRPLEKARGTEISSSEGIGWPLPEGIDEAQLESRLLTPTKRSGRCVEPDFPAIHQELKRKGVTLQLLWSEYTAAHGDQAYRYSQFCFHYQRWRKRQKRSMRQLHRAGEKLFIDYCGPTVAIVDATTGELRQAQVFVAVLGASSYTYAEATWTQELPVSAVLKL